MKLHRRLLWIVVCLCLFSGFSCQVWAAADSSMQAASPASGKKPTSQTASPAAEKTSTPKTAPPALPDSAAAPQSPKLNAAIDKLYLKDNRVFVALVRTGAGGVAAEDYPRVLLRLETSRGSRQWALAEVDRMKALGISGRGRVEFDTGIALDKKETVRAIISLGKIKKSRKDTLVVTAAPTGEKSDLLAKGPAATVAGGKPPRQSAAEMKTAIAVAVNKRKTAQGQTPLNLDDSGGIRITVPGEGQVQKPGDNLLVNAFFLNALANPTAVNDVEFTLRKLGSIRIYATLRRPYRQSSDDRNCQANFPLPAQGLTTSSDYYLMAVHPEAWGVGNRFTIEAPEMAQINFLRPNGSLAFTPGFPMNIDYQFSRHVAEGDVVFRFREAEEEESGSGLVRRSDEALASFTRHHGSNAGQPAEPIHMTTFTLPRDLRAGRYYIEARHPEAFGRSAEFEVAWEGGGRQRVYAAVV